MKKITLRKKYFWIGMVGIVWVIGSIGKVPPLTGQNIYGDCAQAKLKSPY